MRTLDLPSGAGVRFTATARPARDIHFWDLWVVTTTGKPLLVYRSQIGGQDVHQTVEVPAQEVDCRLQLNSRHRARYGWADDQMATHDDAPTMLRIGFYDPAVRGARADDVLFSFTFADPPAGGSRNVRSHTRPSP